MKEPEPTDDTKPSDSREHRAKVTSEQQAEITRLHKAHYGTRRIASFTGLARRTVQEVLRRASLLQQRATPPSPRAAPRSGKSSKTSKLDAFRASVKEKVEQGLRVTRILREIRSDGYTGGRTILADYVRSLEVSRPRTSKVRRRFETAPGEEMQIDWSVYTVPIGDRTKTVRAFSAVLKYSRKAHVRFYFDERQSTLLEAQCHAFADFGGVTTRVVYDRMATVVLGQVGRGGDVIWHPRLLAFAEHYGFDPYACKVADPDRKGTVERFFLYLEEDFVRASSFATLEEMNERVRLWLQDTANCREHGTTCAVPDEQWQAERDLLIRLPEQRFPSYDEELRQVDPDSTLSIRGTRYTVPHEVANKNVWVRLHAEHFEVLAPGGRIVFGRRYVAEQDKGKLQIDPSHYDGLSRGPSNPARGPALRLEEAFLARFPTLANLVVGLKVRLKRLSHIHLRMLWRLAVRYGDDAFVAAATKAQAHRAFNAQAVRRILAGSGATPLPESIPPLTSSGKAAALLGDVDAGGVDDYACYDGGDDGAGDGEEQKGGGDE